MQELKCPNCNKVFQVDETGYAKLVKQIRDKEFDASIKIREKQLEEKNESKIELVKIETKSNYEKELLEKDKEVSKLKELLAKQEQEYNLNLSKLESDKDKKISDKDILITKLEEQIKFKEQEAENAISTAIKEQDGKISELCNELKRKDEENKRALLDANLQNNKINNEKDIEIAKLQEKINSMEQENEYAISIAVKEHEDIITELKNEIKQKEEDKKIALLNAEIQNDKLNNEKDIEIEKLKEIIKCKEDEKKLEISNALKEQEKKISALEKDIAGNETQKQYAISEALREKENEINDIQLEIQNLKSKLKEQEDNEKIKINSIEKDSREKIIEKDKVISQLKEEIKLNKYKEQIAINYEKDLKEKEIVKLKNIQALALVEKDKEHEISIEKINAEIINLKNTIESQKKEHVIKEENLINSIKEKYESQLDAKDEEIKFYKDFKAKQSTKMVGESLEQHCLIEFNKVRMSAFPKAYFEKDNDSRSGSKGDFIYREIDEYGNELLSIMFEMKNEMDDTITKHKNTEFLKELNKDRVEKNCEYAVLVTLLEADNEYYNTGIVEAYQFPKMYIIRPQFFITLISLLRNAAMKAVQYKRDLEMMRTQNIDITNFENELNDFRNAFGRNYDLASRKFMTAIDEIDKTISHLQKVRDNLVSSENNLRLANKKADELSIKKLTRNNPTMQAKFAAINN